MGDMMYSPYDLIDITPDSHLDAPKPLTDSEVATARKAGQLQWAGSITETLAEPITIRELGLRLCAVASDAEYAASQAFPDGWTCIKQQMLPFQQPVNQAAKVALVVFIFKRKQMLKNKKPVPD